MGFEFAAHVLVIQGVAEVEHIALQAVLCFHLALVSLVLCLVLFGFGDHAIDICLGESTLVIGDGNAVLLGCTLVLSRDVENAVDVNIKSDFDLGDTTRSRGDSRKFELAEGVVVFGHGALAFKDLDQNARLIIRVGGEHLRLLRGHSGVAGNERRHHASSSLQSQCQRGDIKKEYIVKLLIGLSVEDGSLYRRTIRHSFIRVDGLGGLLSMEEVLEQLLNLGDSSRTTNQDNLMPISLVNLGITKYTLPWG